MTRHLNKVPFLLLGYQYSHYKSEVVLCTVQYRHNKWFSEQAVRISDETLRKIMSCLVRSTKLTDSFSQLYHRLVLEFMDRRIIQKQNSFSSLQEVTIDKMRSQLIRPLPTKSLNSRIFIFCLESVVATQFLTWGAHYFHLTVNAAFTLSDCHSDSLQQKLTRCLFHDY